jgi:hypothetical protein
MVTASEKRRFAYRDLLARDWFLLGVFFFALFAVCSSLASLMKDCSFEVGSRHWITVTTARGGRRSRRSQSPV